MRFVLLAAVGAVLVACGGPPPPTHTPSPNPGPAAATPPEPTAPEVECNYDRSVFCQPGQAMATAPQPAPFERCALTAPRRGAAGVGPAPAPAFSAAETRAARQATADACCYVEFVARVCR